MKYVFISDFFQEIGGGEMVDARLREFLGGEQILIRSVDCNIEKLSKVKDYRFIISNFIALSQTCKEYIAKNCNYIIWEHDHKYLRTRNPSVFKDWKAPSDQLQNIEFYQSAKSVICQTQQHLDVVFLNTGLNNLVNYGGSLWSNAQLDWLKQCATQCDPHGTAVLSSEIVHKGTKQALEYCTSKNIEPVLLEVMDWEDFVRELSYCKELLFFPQVLETCSRIAVEARMLGLRVIGNNNLSALKEDWFKKYKGVELIEYFKEKNNNIQKFIDTCFWPIKVEKVQEADITVILNLYKRPQNLEKQIDAFRNQTVKPKEIWVWQNAALPFVEGDSWQRHALHFKGIDKWITSNNNWGVYGRFTMAQMAQTKFVCVNDDDTIPGPQWLETCLESYKTNPGLQGGIGVRLEADNYRQHHRIGWADPRPTTEEVDLVGHSWFFPKEYLKYIWMEEPFTWNMEDAHFSYCLQKYGNIKTFVPPQFGDKSSSVLGYELGVDANAMSHPKNHEKFYKERDEAIKYYIDNGWKRMIKKVERLKALEK